MLLVGTTFYRALIASTTGFSSVVVRCSQYWIPAFAGMTDKREVSYEKLENVLRVLCVPARGQVSYEELRVKRLLRVASFKLRALSPLQNSRPVTACCSLRRTLCFLLFTPHFSLFTVFTGAARLMASITATTCFIIPTS